MIYGVKVIHIHTVGENDQRYYEELILRVEADSFDDAYEKAELYMKDAVCGYKNPKQHHFEQAKKIISTKSMRH